LGSHGYVEAEIHITGRVQGVGFRPFIYRLAFRYGLRGYVVNLGDAGVEVVIEGFERSVKSFIDAIKIEAPIVSEITGIKVCYKPYRSRFSDFTIDNSKSLSKSASGIFPPDIGICKECLIDIDNPRGRWFDYPFTACAWCGPRFTGIRALPYDRERTHMDVFPLCNNCKKEYKDSMDRRFDAQGITCNKCGPTMSLLDASGAKIEVVDVFAETAKLLIEENVVAIKGIGGFHLVTLATRDAPVSKLRSRKKRPYQPFALMSPNFEAIKCFADPNNYEINTLSSWRKPIVLIKQRGKIISKLVAPGLDRVGVMLPYTGIQTILFKRLKEPALIMTSGNRTSLPMVITNDSAIKELSGISDYFLVHNREIFNRCDDSLIRVNEGRPVFIRRSRGYVPDPVEIPIKKGIAYAFGSEQSNSAAVTLNGKYFQTQYLGDINNLETIEYERSAIDRMRDLLKITCNPNVIGCDQHPDYMTSQLAEVISHETITPIIKSQHHHAHIVSVCAENNIRTEEEVIGLALDGSGFGSDGTIWGGEILLSNYYGYKRKGHLQQIPMPGGDLCSQNPYRMLISFLSLTMSDKEIRDITKNHVEKGLPQGFQELEIILKQVKTKNLIKTSSSGRYLDAVAALIGLTNYRTYEGEPAMRLESIAAKKIAKDNDIELEINLKNGLYVLKTDNILNYLTINQNKFKKSLIAALAQKYLVEGVSSMTCEIAKTEGINTIALSGGVTVNEYISKNIIKILRSSGLKVLINQQLPPGDGGIALGQSCIALSAVM
jgi:hydrogenase maturation protein HypF